MTATDALGWGSSLLLLVTIMAQIHKQWAARSTRGVSRWLFVGQAGASAGFTAYSALVENWVFTVTNAALLFAAIVGIAITLFNRDKSRPGGAPDYKRGEPLADGQHKAAPPARQRMKTPPSLV